MSPTTALKYISKAKKHIAALELDLACVSVKSDLDVAKINEDILSLRKLINQYEAVLREHGAI